MTPQTIATLNKLNGDFYKQQAESFDATRQHPWNGWNTFIPYLAKKPLSVLDLGCGNGRFEQFLVAHNITLSSYMGMDLSAQLLERATSEKFDTEHVREFKQIDFANLESWPESQQKYDVVVMLALLHHIPSRSLRNKLVSRASTLVKQEGLLILSLWHYEVDSRFKQKIVPWKCMPEIDPNDLETGDHLLTWQNNPNKLRYVHVFDESETQAYIQSSGLRVLHEFRADGASNNLNHYLMLG